MRYLVETHPTESLELIDGVKIIDPDQSGNRQNWVLVLPDASEPSVHIFANSADRGWVESQLRHYRQKVQYFIELEQRTQEPRV